MRYLHCTLALYLHYHLFLFHFFFIFSFFLFSFFPSLHPPHSLVRFLLFFFLHFFLPPPCPSLRQVNTRRTSLRRLLLHSYTESIVLTSAGSLNLKKKKSPSEKCRLGSASKRFCLFLVDLWSSDGWIQDKAKTAPKNVRNAPPPTGGFVMIDKMG
ncbi:hypothetical protein HOY80DRAFT_92677 [Tuber brumale]|nr:hypothetical protein HOY80DRAFT_92677 [Tuber brumale]